MARESDDAVRRRVQRVLDQDTETGVYGLKANVINGEVQLTGIVDTLSEKEKVNKIVSGLKTLFSNCNNPIEIIKKKEIYNMMEEITDACEDVADILERIIMRH
jgi:uncharacterized protein Yka (UPF0111/DUF47 family)